MNILDLKRKAQGWHAMENDGANADGFWYDQQSNALSRLSPVVQQLIKSGKLTAAYDANNGIQNLFTQDGDTQHIYDLNGNFVRTQAAPTGGSFLDKTVATAARVAPLAFMGAAGAGALGYGPLSGGVSPSVLGEGGASAIGAGTDMAGGAEIASSPYSLSTGGGSGLSLSGGSATGMGGGTGLTLSGAGSFAPITPAAGGIFGTGISGTTAALTGAQLLGAKMGSDAAKSAADTQAASARDALGLQQRMYDESVARSKPFYDTSVAANNKLSGLLGLNGASPTSVMENDPGYQFRKDEGMKAVDNSGAARGMSLSGGTLKALQKYGQDYASNEYGNVFNRLSTTAGGGQVANNVNSLATNFGSNAGNTMTDIGRVNAAGAVGSSNAWSGGINDLVNNYQRNELMRLYAPK